VSFGVDFRLLDLDGGLGGLEGNINRAQAAATRVERRTMPALRKGGRRLIVLGIGLVIGGLEQLVGYGTGDGN
jgi:hypothetical protein